MFIPERYRRNPPQRPPSSVPEPADADSLSEPEDIEDPVEQDEPEDVELSDAEFYQSLRRDVAGCREGSIPSITDAMRPPIQNRPWSPRRKRRDRYGRAF